MAEERIPNSPQNKSRDKTDPSCSDICETSSEQITSSELNLDQSQSQFTNEGAAASNIGSSEGSLAGGSVAASSAGRDWSESNRQSSTSASETLHRHQDEAKQKAAQLKQGARETAENVRQQGAQLAQDAKERARQMKDETLQSAAQTAQQAQRKAASYADSQKMRLVDELDTFGDAVARAADKFREDDDQRVASYADMAADQLRATSDYLRTREVGELCGDIEGFARRRPEVFFGGMLLVGLGIARFLKASRRPRARQFDHRDEYDSDFPGQAWDRDADREYAGASYAAGGYGGYSSAGANSDAQARAESSQRASNLSGMNDPLSYH